MHILSRSGATFGALLLLATPALAQTQAPAPTPMPQTSAPAIPGAIATRPIGVVTEASATHWLGSRLDGADVYNAQNDKLGDVADVLLTSDGRVEAVIIGIGGVVGIGTRYVAVSPASLRMTREGDDAVRLVLDTTSEQLRAAPEFRYTGTARTTR
jgi:hypothetical protein